MRSVTAEPTRRREVNNTGLGPQPTRPRLARALLRPLECLLGERWVPNLAAALLILAVTTGLVVTIAITLSIANAVLVVLVAALMLAYCARSAGR